MTSSNGNSPADHFAGNWISVPELRLRDHYFTVPLDYSSVSDSSCPKISVFAREVVAVMAVNALMALLSFANLRFTNTYFSYFSQLVRRINHCHIFYICKVDLALSLHVLQNRKVMVLSFFLELPNAVFIQRGTGLSTPLTTSSMRQMKSAEDLAEYLKHFRADNIVNDAEFIRKRIVPEAGPWTILGQSYGGFCAVTYLSFAPQGLKQVLVTGGIPPVADGCTADAVYHACFEKISRQTEKYYERFPQDVEVVQDIVKFLANSEGGGVPLPSGGMLTPRGLQTLGLSGLGAGAGAGFERLHYMLERAWDPVITPGAQKQLSYCFLNAFDNWGAFNTNPLYVILHELIYCEGAPSQWAAHRVREANGSKFDAIKAAKEGRPVYFTGEMVFPWMFDEISSLKHLKEVAHILSEKKDWPPLYDVAALENNKVPVAAALYYEDMFVNFNLAMKTAEHISGIRLWITNEYMHSGLQDGGSHVFDHLMEMLNGKRPLF
uniref:AB hydrolase-1 domain-containing protein n=1 Tax=Chenopodium quinoa TaxID=63459 RepID=A0A803M322_CHEQI